jgi:glycosyltransferase involved in cell wall biosynthesis
MRHYFSVVIPVFNRGNLLLKTLNSLYNQSIGIDNFEIIIVDDGSSEDIFSLIHGFYQQQNLNIRYFFQKNNGPASARNNGSNQANADWVAFIDSDVIADENWLKKAYHYLEDTRKKNISLYQKLGAIEGCTLISHQEKKGPFTHQTENKSGGKYPTCNLIVRKKLCHFYPEYKKKYFFREDSDLAFSILSCNKEIIFLKGMIVYHPPLRAEIFTPFRLALRYQHDALLKKRFNKLYKSEIDFHKIGGWKIPHLRKKIYGYYLVSLLLACSFLLLHFLGIFEIIIHNIFLDSNNLDLKFLLLNSSGVIPAAFTLNYLISLLAVFYIMIRSGRFLLNKSFEYLMIFLFSMLVPVVMYYSLIKGKFIYKNEKNFSPNDFLNGYK